MKIVASSPDLGLSGANVLLAQVLRGLEAKGNDLKWVVSSHEGSVEAEWLNHLGVRFSVLPRTRIPDVKARQRMLLAQIEEEAPCCYFPNYDFDMLWAVEAMPSGCRTIFIMHCDDPVYYEAIEQRGRVMDAIVCVSAYLATEVRRRWPELSSRVHHIPFGVELADEGGIHKAALSEGFLEVVYCGRLVEEQKRIGDLAEIILNCHQRNLPVRFHIAGSGSNENSFFDRLKAPLAAGCVVRLGKLPHNQVAPLLARCHVFILTSAYEGLPVSLLEAMAYGCVPVVTAVESGIPEVIDAGINGFLFPIGDTEGFTQCLARLAGDSVALSNCAQSARATIEQQGYTLDTSLERYLHLCSQVLQDGPAVQARKPSGPLTPPRYCWHKRFLAKFGW